MTTMPSTPDWKLPHTTKCKGDAIAVFFLCPLNKNEIAKICNRLTSADPWTEFPDINVSPVVPVPWMHDFTPSLSVIYEIGGCVFIDEQSIKDDTAIFANKIDSSDAEIARVPFGKVNIVANILKGGSKSLFEIVSRDSAITVEKAAESKHVIDTGEGADPLLPPHLPASLKLEPSILTLISLVHIPEKELSTLKSTICASEDTANVEIINWPADKAPGARADLHRIFQAVRPNIADIDEDFVLFLDRDWQQEGPEYQILRAQQMRRQEQASTSDGVVNVDSLKDIKRALELWHIIWNPFERGNKGVSVNGGRVNPILFNWPRGKGVHFEYGPYSDRIPNPDKFVFGWGSPVFILQEISERDVQVVQSYLLMNELDNPVLYNISRHIPSPDMQGLIAFFESEEFLATGQKPPEDFIAVDNITRDIAQQVIGQNNQSDHAAKRPKLDDSNTMIFASQSQLSLEIQDDQEETYARVGLGYAYARRDPYEAISAWNNLEVGNMYFHECIHDWLWVNWKSAETYLKENTIIDDAEKEEGLVLAGAFYPGNEEFVRPETYG